MTKRKLKLIGVDYATEDGDHTVRVYGKWRKGVLIIDRIIHWKPRRERKRR